MIFATPRPPSALPTSEVSKLATMRLILILTLLVFLLSGLTIKSPSDAPAVLALARNLIYASYDSTHSNNINLEGHPSMWFLSALMVA